jgi:Flp pilus assembly pilin Flp
MNELEVVKETVTAGSVMNHVKANRIEYALCLIALHLLGASDLVISKVSGVCF